MKPHTVALLTAVLVVLAFALLIARWVTVANLAAHVDTHRLDAAEEQAVLAARALHEQEVKK